MILASPIISANIDAYMFHTDITTPQISIPNVRLAAGERLTITSTTTNLHDITCVIICWWYWNGFYVTDVYRNSNPSDSCTTIKTRGKSMFADGDIFGYLAAEPSTTEKTVFENSYHITVIECMKLRMP